MKTKQVKEESRKPWDYLLKDLTILKTQWDDSNEEFIKNYVPFMINRWLSFCGDWAMPIVNALNNSEMIMNKKAHYMFLLNVLPKDKLYMNWVKGKEANKDEIDSISEYFEISNKDARSYFNLLPDDVVLKIMSITNDRNAK